MAFVEFNLERAILIRSLLASLVLITNMCKYAMEPC